jgi:hypothetical protein
MYNEEWGSRDCMERLLAGHDPNIPFIGALIF